MSLELIVKRSFSIVGAILLMSAMWAKVAAQDFSEEVCGVDGIWAKDARNNFDRAKALAANAGDTNEYEKYRNLIDQYRDDYYSVLTQAAQMDLNFGSVKCVNTLMKMFRIDKIVRVKDTIVQNGKHVKSLDMFSSIGTFSENVAIKRGYQILFGGNSLLGKYLAKDVDIEMFYIRNSISEYKYPCPCPYSRDDVGNVCGERSAWSTLGGKFPICYRNQVTPDLKFQYRDSYAETLAQDSLLSK